MSLSIRLLGTSASRPTIERNVSSLAIHREGETLMFDCGEGTQRQMMRYGVSFALADGRVVARSVLVGGKRPGRTAVITEHTRPSAATLEDSHNADQLVHEATFGDEEAERGVETGHATAREAAQIASGAGVRRLL